MNSKTIKPERKKIVNSNNAINLSSNNKDTKMKPFVKWAGGKTQLLKELNVIKPNSFKKYIEPFVGGGAFLLNLEPKKAIINDINKELINAFQVIKNNHYELIKKLIEIAAEHNKCKTKKSFYLKMRSDEKTNSIEKAARFIYLNKTCFNGLYRENNKGQFNVPYNGKNKLILDNIFYIDNIEKISNFLKTNNIKIFNKDYKYIIKSAKKSDFMFVDPPYDKEDKKSFTKYNKNDFNEQNQIELAKILKKADKKGVKWILTNHNTSLINELYKEFNKKEVVVNRMINPNSKNRIKATTEVIFWNY